MNLVMLMMGFILMELLPVEIVCFAIVGTSIVFANVFTQSNGLTFIYLCVSVRMSVDMLMCASLQK